jgi:hypothetical protein
MKKLLLVTLLAASLTGCAAMPNAYYVETEHVSHPLAGWPVGSKDEEDSLNQLNVGAEWRNEGAYLQMSLGYVLTDGGFYGPKLTATMRAGYKFQVAK